MGPRFVSWPVNQEVDEGNTVTVECNVENCSSLIMSREFLPVINLKDFYLNHFQNLEKH